MLPARRLALLAALTAARAAAPQPWPPLAGGAFSGPAVPLSPDPLVRYVFNASTDVTSLYVFDVAPVAAWLYEGTPAASFDGWSSLASPAPRVVVSGAGTLAVDFGTELPAWIEFDSADLTPADAARLLLGCGEYAAVDIVGTDAKQRAPVQYGSTWRLETNKELYEGVRFGFLSLAAPPAAPFTITALRAVAQAKPVNYTGSYNADKLSTQIYYAAAYTVRTNLEKGYMGAILEDRGDRISWAGDAHVSQAASLAVFGNTWDVRQNLNVTGVSQNGIASYSLYFVDSIADYFAFTHDANTVSTYAAEAARILDGALAGFNMTTHLEFFGWDVRLKLGAYGG
jgi:alpha-L-rhamnosidase